MSFLQINSTNPSVKRPFRLSDIQDIWNGITSLFKPIKGELFRIISGFNLEGSTYSAGAVYYDGNIYEYDCSKPITSSTSVTYFAKIAVDARQFEGGTSHPFAYKYVCGGSSFASESGYVSQASSTDFRTNIPKYKSYLGTGSVTTEKLADQSVTEEKIGFFYTPAIPYNRSDNVKVTASSTNFISSFIAPFYLKAFEINGGTTHTIIVNVSDTRSLYSTLPLMVLNNTSATVTINFTCSGASDYKPSQTIQTISIPANTKKVIPLYHVVPTLNGASPIYVVADTAF